MKIEAIDRYQASAKSYVSADAPPAIFLGVAVLRGIAAFLGPAGGGVQDIDGSSCPGSAHFPFELGRREA